MSDLDPRCRGAMGLDTATLRSANPKASDDWLRDLYASFGSELGEVSREMAQARASMRERGCTTDFGDRESELLYLLIRHLQPEVVVEMSPCHGYSTGYILKAVTRNGKGVCHSYEIIPSFNGIPIADLIRANLPRGVDLDRWVLHSGDARKESIPAADFLFIDSSHSVTFAAWYCETLVPRAKRLVMVHDIVVACPGGGVVPKAAFLGMNEQYFLLQWLAENRQSCFALGDSLGRMEGTLPRYASRYPVSGLAAERSIVFHPMASTPSAAALSGAAHRTRDVLDAYVNGDRTGAIDTIRAVSSDPGVPLFGRLLHQQLLPVMGYKWGIASDVYPSLQLDGTRLSVSELMCALELLALNGHSRSMDSLLHSAARGPIADGVLKYIVSSGLARIARQAPWP